MTYAEWIAAHKAQHGAALFGRCRKSVDEMRAAFPELTEVRGHVYVFGWGKRGHAWLTTPDGDIVDPTASQFPGIAEYEPWQPGDEVRVGKCMNCGEEIWAPVETLDMEPRLRSVCGAACEAELIAELG